MNLNIIFGFVLVIDLMDFWIFIGSFRQFVVWICVDVSVIGIDLCHVYGYWFVSYFLGDL